MNPSKTYFFKAFLILPLTFLFTPIFHFALPYQPNENVVFFSSAFGLLVYIWYALFMYFGMAVGLSIKKRRWLSYPIIIAAAWFTRFLAAHPALDLQATHISADVFGEYIIYIPISDGERAIYLLIVFATSALAGCFASEYARKDAHEVMRRGNLILFANIAILGGIFLHGNILYTVLFAVSYFIMRNFCLIQRELDVYNETGKVKVSGVRRVIAYYFGSTFLFAVMPVIVGVIIIPMLWEHISRLAVRVFMWLLNVIMDYERDLPTVEHPDLPYGDAPPLAQIPGGEAGGFPPEFYLAILAVLAVIALIFLYPAIKEFWRKKDAVLSDRSKGDIISEEVIQELQKDEKGRAAYRGYMKNARKIGDIRNRFLYIYNCLHWEIVKKENLSKSSTPLNISQEAEFKEISDIALMYSDMKYGDIEKDNALLNDMTKKTEILLRRVL